VNSRPQTRLARPRPRPPGRRAFTSKGTVLLGLAIAVLLMFPMLVRLFTSGSVAPTPEIFVNTPRLSDAMASHPGRPVVVFATADWCPPCQSMKRETLVDPRVAELIRERATPVYMNVDQDSEAGKLGIYGIPATLVIWDGTTIARQEGFRDAEAYLSFLRDAFDLASKPEEVERIRRAAKPAVR